MFSPRVIFCHLLAIPSAAGIIRRVVKADGVHTSQSFAPISPEPAAVGTFAQAYKAVCNAAFNAPPSNGAYPPTAKDGNSYFWAERLFNKFTLHEEGGKLRTTSDGVQRDLFKLAQIFYFGKLPQQRRPIIWGGDREPFKMIGGAWENKYDASSNKSSWFYIGVGKNAITSFHQYLNSQGWEGVKREAIQQAGETRHPNIFYVAREPIDRLVSAYVEVSTVYPGALPARAKDIAAEDHFRTIFDMFIGQDGKCDDRSVVWCNKKTWGWVHLAPQMWFLEWWFPVKGGRSYSINASFDLRKSSSEFTRLWSDMGHSQKPDVKRENVKGDIAVKRNAIASMKNETLQRAACAFYARDYLCLGYDLPKACQQDEKIIASTLFRTWYHQHLYSK